jgi:tetratricopeptide (TPR) repeat protein
MRLIITIILWLSIVGIHAQNYETDFREAQRLFDERATTTHKYLQAYLKDYPYTPYIDEIYLMQGVLYVEKGKYKQAQKSFQQLKAKNLSRAAELKFFFYQGYTHLQQEEYAKALACMKKLKKKQNPYFLQATYYTGYCYYKQQEYQQALVEFLSLEELGGYNKIAPYYVVQIYYAFGQYDKIYERAEQLLKKYPNNEYNDELHRMLGEIYYQDSIYNDAVRHFKAYYQLRNELKKEIVRNDLYLLGISCYKEGLYEDAIDFLKQVKQTPADSIAENTCLHLGHSYLRINDIEKAKLSYAAAIAFGITDALREEAMYNYVQVTYLQNSALGESITAFQTFIKEYPTSKYIDKVYALMADMYLSSKNYQAALAALEEVQQPSEKIQNTKQHLRYQLAADTYLQGKMQETLTWCEQVISNSKQKSEYQTEAYYLSAEAYYHLHQYDQVIRQLLAYESQTAKAESPNKNAAHYLKAYAYFNQKAYTEALPVYSVYIGLINQQDKTYPDALNRIGDCYFHSRQFEKATQAYEQVATIGSIGADYALLQKAYAEGLMHQYIQKVETLDKLINEYPKSDLADDALYEMARTKLQLEEHNQAISIYNKLLAEYPNSNKSAKSSLELGMTHRTLKAYEEALKAFKQTIEKYPATEEAYSALDGIEQIYVETNNVSEYIAYTKTLSKMRMQSASSEDSLVYVTGELQYIMGNYEQAAAGLSTYLTRFCPGGRYCVNAMHYAANSYYQLKQYNEAIEQYSALADVQGNPYMEEACMRVAELSYDKQEYRTAQYYFQRMHDVASNSQMRQTALLGMLRCSHHIQDTTTIVEYAGRLLEIEALDETIRNEALYCRAGAQYLRGEYGLAVVDYNLLAKNVRTIWGAEAKYKLAECYYHLGAIDMAEQEIMSFTSMQTSHQYWLAKSLILLADINVNRNDLFQAKQYLLALQNNYRQLDDISTLIADKLATIQQLEMQQNIDTTQNE